MTVSGAFSVAYSILEFSVSRASVLPLNVGGLCVCSAGLSTSGPS